MSKKKKGFSKSNQFYNRTDNTYQVFIERFINMAKPSKGIKKKSSKTSSKILKKNSKSTSSKVDKLDSKIDVSEITLLQLNQSNDEKKKSILDHKSLKKDHDKDVETKENEKKNEGDLMKQLELIGFKA